MIVNFNSIKSIGDAIKEFVSAHNLKPKLEEADIALNWHKIVGDVTARYTTEVYLTRGTLTIKLKSAALRKELMMNKTQLINVINNYYEKNIVNEIIFR